MNTSELLARLLIADREYRSAVQEARAHGGAIVLEARRTLGLTQRGLADAISVDHTYISKIENGAALVSKPVLAKIAQLLEARPPTD